MGCSRFLGTTPEQHTGNHAQRATYRAVLAGCMGWPRSVVYKLCYTGSPHMKRPVCGCMSLWFLRRFGSQDPAIQRPQALQRKDAGYYLPKRQVAKPGIVQLTHPKLSQPKARIVAGRYIVGEDRGDQVGVHSAGRCVCVSQHSENHKPETAGQVDCI